MPMLERLGGAKMRFELLSVGEGWELWKAGAWFYLKDVNAGFGRWQYDDSSAKAQLHAAVEKKAPALPPKVDRRNADDGRLTVGGRH
jgi:hypothetical protein